MPVEGVIRSGRNRRVVQARKLRLRKYRQSSRSFLVEGLQLIHMGLASDCPPVEVFYCEELFAGTGAPSLLERCRQAGSRLTPVTDSVMRALSERDTPQGLLAVFSCVDGALDTVPVPIDGDALILVLDRLQNPGNLGTLVRTADAVGAAAVILREPGADFYDAAAVRSSMGSLFNVPLVRASVDRELFAWLQPSNCIIVGADPYRGEWWNAGVWPGRLALVLGNEGSGLSEDVRAHIQRWVRLPMVGRAESLNVAVTGGVLMYAWMGRHGPPV